MRNVMRLMYLRLKRLLRRDSKKYSEIDICNVKIGDVIEIYNVPGYHNKIKESIVLNMDSNYLVLKAIRKPHYTFPIYIGRGTEVCKIFREESKLKSVLRRL